MALAGVPRGDARRAIAAMTETAAPVLTAETAAAVITRP